MSIRPLKTPLKFLTMNFDPNDFQDLADVHKIRQLSEINKKLGQGNNKSEKDSNLRNGVIYLLFFAVPLSLIAVMLLFNISNHNPSSNEEDKTYLPASGYNNVDTNNIYEKEKTRLLELSAKKQNDAKNKNPKETTAKPKDEDPAAKSEREINEIRRKLGITPSR